MIGQLEPMPLYSAMELVGHYFKESGLRVVVRAGRAFERSSSAEACGAQPSTNNMNSKGLGQAPGGVQDLVVLACTATPFHAAPRPSVVIFLSSALSRNAGGDIPFVGGLVLGQSSMW